MREPEDHIDFRDVLLSVCAWPTSPQGEELWWDIFLDNRKDRQKWTRARKEKKYDRNWLFTVIEVFFFFLPLKTLSFHWAWPLLLKWLPPLSGWVCDWNEQQVVWPKRPGGIKIATTISANMKGSVPATADLLQKAPPSPGDWKTTGAICIQLLKWPQSNMPKSHSGTERCPGRSMSFIFIFLHTAVASETYTCVGGAHCCSHN